jgi:hypothetical protein
VKETAHLHPALILIMREAIPSLSLRLQGAVLNKAEEKFYLIDLVHVN